MSPSSNQLLSLPNELQTLIWKSYLTNTVFDELHDKVTVYNDTYPDYKVGVRCDLNYHGFKPFQSDVSGQRTVHTEYAGMESDSEDSEYSHDSWGEYAYDSSDDDDSD
jgi:hypothetical protein